MKHLIILTLLSFLITNSAYSDNINYLKTQNPEIESSSTKTDIKSGNKTLKITPLDSCFSKLEEKELEEIKKHYTKPYTECLKRVAMREKEKRTIEYKKSEEKKLEEKKIINQPDKTTKEKPAENL